MRMTIERQRALRRIGVMVGIGLAGCAEGREPPKPTQMIEIRNGLQFDFGPEGACRNGSTGGAVAVTQTCASPAPLEVRYPKVTVELTAFALDVHEVTNLQYQYCVAKGACTPPRFGNAPDTGTQADYYDNARFENYPVVNVTWPQADEYCKFVDKRLPSEFEWERVAKGANGQRQFPTEEAITTVNQCIGVFNSLGCGGNQVMEEVATSAKDFVEENGVKVYNLGGNAAEWTATPWRQDTTCLEAAPCPTKNECTGITNPNDKLACETAATIDPSQPGGCSDCNTLSDGECYFMCEDVGAARSLVCTAYTEVMTPDDVVVDAPNMAIRGGDVTVPQSQTCRFHSWNRSFNQSKAFVNPAVGFRCAKDL